MSETARLVTAEEFEKYPDDDYRYELVEGRVVRMSPPGYIHGRITMAFGALLHQHVRAQALGVVFNELGCKLKSNPDTVRGPDIAFIRTDRIPAKDPKGFWRGAPDLAVEVLSPDDTRSEIRAKTAEYLEAGVGLVVVVDPEKETVSLFARHGSTGPLRGDDIVDLDDVVAGFRCRVNEIFE
jgi:Uma2 family endonuclease